MDWGGGIAPGDTLHLRCRKKTVQKMLHGAGPADDSVDLGCMLGFIPACSVREVIIVLNVCHIIAAPTSGLKKPPVLKMPGWLKCTTSSSQVHDLHSVATVKRPFKKQANLAGI